jgi:tRNA dimethylallyltransferase
MAQHLALVGPTASGKSAIALAVAAERDDVEIVTVDSMQVYRGMDIGTAKPSAAEQAAVPHHLLDLVDPHEDHTVAEWQRAARVVLADIEARGHRALLVGGTGLYLRALVDDLDIPGRWPGCGPPSRPRWRPSGARRSTSGWPASIRSPPLGWSRATSDAWSGPSR